MSSLPFPALIASNESEQGQDVSLADTALLRRLGIESLPAHETLTIAIEKLIVPEADHMLRSAKKLVKSITRIGMLQQPSVVVRDNLALHDEDATFDVIAGRRRVLAARLARLPVVKCEAYTSSTLPLSALLLLIENEQRSAAWIQEVEALRRLLDEKVGLTLDDLTAFGFDRMHLHERLKIAQLPAPLVERILAGNVKREVARKLTRLTTTQQERVVQQLQSGEEMTEERVKETLRAQIDAGLYPLQSSLSQGWSESPSASAYVVPAPTKIENQPSFAREEPDEKDVAQQNNSSTARTGEIPPASPVTASLQEVIHTLQAFEQSADYRLLPRAVQTLTQSLVQQLVLSLRQRSPLSATETQK